MAQLGNLLVKGSSRFLNKAYFEDIYICGDVSTGGKLDITANEGKSILSLNRKRALEVYDNWLNINESGDFASGIYCGNGILRTDGEFQVGTNGNRFKVNNSSLASYVPSTFSAQATFNGGLIASSANISEEICNTLIVKDELRSAKWSIDNITNLGSTFYVSPCIVFTNPSVYVNSISGTTVVLTITDNSITSSTIGGATWTNGSKVKLMGRIGNSALGTINGVLKRDLNSSTAKTAYISLDFPNTDLIKFSAGATYSGSNVGDLKMMMYEVNKNVNGTTKNRPIGILLSSYGENKKPCIDIYNGDIEDGSPVARMGYLNGLPSVNGVSPTGYGFYAAGNAYFSGTLVSSSGKIGGFEISQYKMVNDSGNGDIIGICSTSGQEWAIWTGASKGANAPFHVGHNGYLYASNANISGVITATSGRIGGCDISNGKLIVPSANISGKLNASQIQIGDFTNYSDLTVDTYERYWFTLVPDGNNNPWFQCTPNRDITINPVSYDTYKCKGGETFKIEFEVSSTVKAANADGHGSNTYVDINVGLYCKNTKGESQWYIPYGTTSDAAGTVKTVSTQVTLGSSVRSFSVGIQCAGFAPFSGTLKIRNISVRRMADEALIVNGSITADKITTNNISGTNGWINLRSGLFDYGNGKLKWDGKSLSIAGNGKFAGEITATSGKIGKYNITNNYLISGSGSTCTGMGGNQAFWAGSNNSNNAPFHVSYDGSLYASKANISGTINSTDGSIGGWKISSGSFSSGKTYQGETYDIYLNSSGKIIASNENKYNNNKIIFGIFPEIYGRSVYDAGIQILNKEGNNSLLMHDQIVFSHMDNMSNPFQKTAQMTKYDYEGIKFGWAWNVKNGNDWSETTIKSQIYWNEDDSTINFSGADISLNDGKWLYLQKGCIALKNNAYIYTTTKENNLISLIGYSVSNTLWVGDYNNFTGGNCIITANNVYKNASGSWTSLSDARYKHDFKEISHATDFILGLNPCLYKFNDGTSDRYHMGFKAQEVEKNMLSTIGDTGLTVKYNCTEGLDVDLNNPETYMLGLRYDELIAPLIQVVQEQQYKIQELEKKVTALSN